MGPPTVVWTFPHQSQESQQPLTDMATGRPDLDNPSVETPSDGSRLCPVEAKASCTHVPRERGSGNTSTQDINRVIIQCQVPLLHGPYHVAMRRKMQLSEQPQQLEPLPIGSSRFSVLMEQNPHSSVPLGVIPILFLFSIFLLFG